MTAFNKYLHLATVEALHIVHLREHHAHEEELTHEEDILHHELRESAVDLFDAMFISFI